MVQLDGDAAGRMAMPSRIDEANVADGPVIPGGYSDWRAFSMRWISKDSETLCRAGLEDFSLQKPPVLGSPFI